MRMPKHAAIGPVRCRETGDDFDCERRARKIAAWPEWARDERYEIQIPVCRRCGRRLARRPGWVVRRAGSYALSVLAGHLGDDK